MTGKTAKLLLTLLAALTMMAVTACDDLTTKEVEVTFPLGGDVNLSQSAGPGLLDSISGTTDVYRYYLDPNSNQDYKDNKDKIDEITNPRFLATIRNNSGCSSTFNVYLSRSSSGGIPGDAVKVASLSVPGPAGNSITVSSGSVLTSNGAATIISYVNSGTPFYVYLEAMGAGCSNYNLTVSSPKLGVTLKIDLL
jgi:hypothetical protein